MARVSAPILITYLLAGLAVTGCGGGSRAPSGNSPPSTQPPPSNGAIQVTGRERIGWVQTAAAIDALHFGVYVDTARVDLPATVCHDPQEDTWTCDSPLPPLSAGAHALEVVAWVIAADGQVVEGARAVPLNVFVTTSSLTAQLAAGKTPSPTGPPDAPMAHLSTGCGLAPFSQQEFLAWDDTGAVRLIDRQTASARPLIWDHDRSEQAWTLSGAAVHPAFDENHWIYLATLRAEGTGASVRLMRYREVAQTLGERAILLETTVAFRPSRVALTFGADTLLRAALLGPDSDAPTASRGHAHPFVIRVDDRGRVPDGNEGHSIFDRFVASAPLAIAWTGVAGQWMIERSSVGRYALTPIPLESVAPMLVPLDGRPVALQAVATPRGRELWLMTSTGQLVTLQPAGAGWSIGSRLPLLHADGPLRDALVLDDASVAGCAASGDGHYGVWRARPPV